MNILMVAAEYAPLAKVGGLADAVAGLAGALARRGHDVRVVLPCYDSAAAVEAGFRPRSGPPLPIRVGQKFLTVRFLERARPGRGPRVYQVDEPSVFGGGVYAYGGEATSSPLVRAGLLAQAALLLPGCLEWPVDIVHAHDAQAALVPVYRRQWFDGPALPGPAGTVLTIHNLAHQEIHAPGAVADLGLPATLAAFPGLLEFHGNVNLMKAGILAADRINTVSPTYAHETVTDPAFGCGLEGVLAGRGEAYSGILNGADYDAWNPRTDRALPAAFSAASPAGRESCRAALRSELGLELPADRPLCGFVGRLVAQKGLDLALPLVERLAGDGFGFALLGTGDAALEQQAAAAAAALPGRVAFVCGFDDALARRIYAGCDLFLMPSVFEPCGLGQMYALRYGAPPVVRRTGGLADTVVDAAEPDGDGFVFDDARPDALLAALRRAGHLWEDRDAWADLQARGLRRVFDWDRSAAGYEGLYKAATGFAGGMTMAGDDLDQAREALIAEGFRGSRQPMLLVDVDGRVAAASAGVAELAGVARETITGGACADWFLPEGAIGQCTLLGGCQGGLRRQAQLRNVNGELIPVEIVCSSFHAEPLPGTGADAAPDDDIRRHCFFHIEDIRQREHDDQVRAARQAKLPLLNQVSEALYGAHLTLDQLQQAILICVTAGQGLRFNRAFLLLVDDAGTILRGELAIGPSNHEEAARIWHDLAYRPADLFEMMTSYDQSIKNTNAAVNEIVRKMVVSLERTDHILVRAMHERRVVRVTGDMQLPGADELRAWLGGGQFAAAPLTIRSGPVGVIVADNAISGQEISDLDLEFLQMFANQSAAAVENSRLYRELEKRLVDLRRAHHQQKEDQQTLLRMERLSVMGETSAIVAHELRNPLVGIGGFARTLMRNLDENDPNHRFAAIISEEVARMEEIIHDLLDFIRPRKMLRQETVIDTLVIETTERFRGELEGAGVRLAIQPGCGELALDCHPGEIQQVLQNYLMNALQAQALGGQVIVRTSLLEGGLKVEVLDSGPGFAEADGKRLFSPFFSTKPTGSGLGLTICAQIIKAHGGVTGAANRPEGGATFWFILPLPRG